VNSSAFKRGTCNKQGQPGIGSKLFYINWWGYDLALQPSAPLEGGLLLASGVLHDMHFDAIK
jgi:hypothetical protein